MTLLQAIGLFAGCLSGSFIGVWLGRKLTDKLYKKTPTKAVANVNVSFTDEQAAMLHDGLQESLNEVKELLNRNWEGFVEAIEEKSERIKELERERETSD